MFKVYKILIGHHKDKNCQLSLKVLFQNKLRKKKDKQLTENG